MITWITGNSGAGKTTLAKRLRKSEILLDGDEMREVWPGLGFEIQDRYEQNIRIARLAKILESQGNDVIVATICPYYKLRKDVQKITNCRFIYLEGGNEKGCPYEK